MSRGYLSARGLIHSGKHTAKVYDIAAMHETEIAIPVASQVTDESTLGVDRRIRRSRREVFREHRLLKRLPLHIGAPTGISADAGEDTADLDAWFPTALWEELKGQRVEVQHAGPET